MTLLVDADMQGIAALRDEEADTVLFWFEDLKERHGDPAAQGPDTSFDEAAWSTLPTFEQLWDPVPELHELMRDLVAGAGSRAEEWLDMAQRMADLEYEIKKGRDRDDSGAEGDTGGTGADGSVGAAAAGGSGGAVPGGSKDGDKVGKGRRAKKLPNNRGASQVQGADRPGEAGGGPDAG